MNPSVTAASYLVAALLLVASGYALVCAVAPWGRCRKCTGTGRVRRTWCRRCDGTGLRVRVGRRLYHWIDREYRDGNR